MSAPSIQIKSASHLSNLFPQTSVLVQWATERANCATRDDVQETQRRAEIIGELLAMTPVGDESWAIKLATEYRFEMNRSTLPMDIAHGILWQAAARFYRKHELAHTLKFPISSVEELSATDANDILHDIYATLNAGRADFWGKIYRILYL